jgi:LacI family transcriptional regulator
LRSTIKDVSREAGVSIKTVSRVLNKEPRVSAATRERVLAAVSMLNFRPSAAARTLAGRRSFQIALACDNPSPFYVYEMQSGIRDRCALDGVRMIAQPYDHDSERLIDDIESLIDTTGVDGLILTPPATDYPEVLELLRRRGVPFVRVSPGTDIGMTPSVFIDNVRAAAAMTRHLLALGHRRIGFITGHGSYATSAQRLTGFTIAMEEAGLTVDPALVRHGDYSFSSGADAAEALLAMAEPPTAIFASNDEMAAGTLSVAHRMRLAVPEALSVAGFGDDAIASCVWPPLTTIRQATRKLGYEAADLLLASGPEREAGPEHEEREIPFDLVRRESTAAPPLK